MFGADVTSEIDDRATTSKQLFLLTIPTRLLPPIVPLSMFNISSLVLENRASS